MLASPLVGLSLDGLVVLLSAAHGAGRDPWWVIREPDGRLDGLAAADRARLARFARVVRGRAGAGGAGSAFRS